LSSGPPSETRRRRALALVPYPLDEAPGQRYRIEQWAPYLRDAGIDVDFAPFAEPGLAARLYRPREYWIKTLLMSRAWLKRLRTVWASRRFDAVYLYREAALVGPALLERALRWRNPHIVYDFDDAIWMRYVSPRNRYLSYLKAPGKTATICRIATTVVVGNQTLAEFARRHNPAVVVVPSTVSLRTYRQRPSPAGGAPPVVGWTGSHSSAQYLKLIERALQAMSRTRRFRVRVVGLEGYRIPGVDVEAIPWRADTEVQDLWPIDIGVMPLSDDEWSRGKCGMKAIQFMGIGLPVVVSPVGANREVVDDGITGFHALREQDWIARLGELMDDPRLAQRMGEAGRRRVENHYSAEVHAPRIAALLAAAGQ
jgi:glycosyltransferase involved in cell wall biosynthesis